MLKIAWRNLWRHRTRTLITGSVIAFTYALALVAMGMSDDMYRRMIESAAEGAGGDVLVHGDGWWEARSNDVALPAAEPTLERVRAVEGVEAAIPRVVIGGLVSTSEGNHPVQLQGIRPEAEARLTDLRPKLVEGTLFDEAYERPIVLGRGIVEELEIAIGDRVVLTATGADGELARALFHLSGVVATGLSETDALYGYTTIAAARDAIGLDAGLTQIGVLVDPDADNAAVAERIRTVVPEGTEVLTWQEAAPEMVAFVQMDQSFGFLYIIIVFVIVAFAIANTFLMAVMERVREFGLLNALGLKNGRIGLLLLQETMLLTLIAMGVGLLLGLGGHLALDHFGLDVARMYNMEVEISGVNVGDMVIHSAIDPGKWLIGSILVALLTIGSALYPAWRASRLAPAEAMRFFD